MSLHRNLTINYSQKDTKFLEIIYFYRRCTCFRRFLRPSSGARNCTYSFRYCQPILLLAATVKEMELCSTIYFYRRSTCFRRFLCPSSGAHNSAYSFRYYQPILLLAATVQEYWLTIPEAVCTVMCS